MQLKVWSMQVKLVVRNKFWIRITCDVTIDCRCAWLILWGHNTSWKWLSMNMSTSGVINTNDNTKCNSDPDPWTNKVSERVWFDISLNSIGDIWQRGWKVRSGTYFKCLPLGKPHDHDVVLIVQEKKSGWICDPKPCSSDPDMPKERNSASDLRGLRQVSRMHPNHGFLHAYGT